MSERERLLKQFDALNVENFQDFALALFQYQSKYNLVYKKYISALNIDPNTIKDLRSIPYLPIEFFKQHRIISNAKLFKSYDAIFESSGTTSGLNSQHFLPNLNQYLSHAASIFTQHYGEFEDYIILALLPIWKERILL